MDSSLHHASRVHTSRFRVQLGTEVPKISSDQLADACMLYWLMPPQRQREFWQLKGNRAAKLAFLLRWGHFEQWRPA
jgi:hypothetical protein